jgi:excisionase family DNA binding protein
MAAVVEEREPVAASETERADLDRVDRLIERALETGGSRPRLIGPEGDTVELPESVLRLLRRVVHHLAEGRMVTIVPIHEELTTQEAADLLNVSRPYFVKLLNQGEIPYTKTGTHRRVRFRDVMAYKEGRDAQRREGLAELTRLSKEIGLYDE